MDVAELVGTIEVGAAHRRQRVHPERHRGPPPTGELTVPSPAPHRVVQWTTGNVGKSSVQAIVANPTLELVGCYAWSPDKVGRDVGELCGIEPLGITATDDIDALLALQPGLRRLQPDVERHRRAGAHPRRPA